MIDKLSPRQCQVLLLLSRGLSNKEIARVLGIAEATTKVHLASLIRALNVKNRVEAAYKCAGIDWEAEIEKEENGGKLIEIGPLLKRIA